MIALTSPAEGAYAAEKGHSTIWCRYDEGDPRRERWLEGWACGNGKKSADRTEQILPPGNRRPW